VVTKTLLKPLVTFYGKECNNSFSLGSREKRASLLKDGFTGKDIESEYPGLNGIVVIRVNLQDLKSK